MSLQNTRLTSLAYIASTVGTLYTNAASTHTFVRGIMLHNTNTTNEVVQLYWVPDSGGLIGSAAASNRFAEPTLAPKETLFIEFPFSLVMLNTNETIQGNTTTASKVTCAILGDKDV